MPSPIRGTHWTFTSFKSSKPDFDEKTMRYMVYQKEKCPKTGKEHFQGYVQFLLKKTMTSAKKALNDEKVHLDLARADSESNKAYCTKEESRIDGPWEFGKSADQGTRTDLEAAAELAMKNDMKAIEPTTYVKFHRGLHALRNLHVTPETREIRVTVIWGETGVGKSHMAHELAGKEAYWKPAGQWWDDYNGEKTVVIDDFDPKENSESTVLRWMDKWPLRVPVKGGFVAYGCERLIMTSHYAPETWFPEREKEVMRRINQSIQINERNHK